jgi:hypothetical protein
LLLVWLFQGDELGSAWPAPRPHPKTVAELSDRRRATTSSVEKSAIDATGPNTSSSKARILGLTPVSTVGR